MTTPAYYLIPLTNTPQQIQITLAGIDYTITAKWNDIGQSWILDIGDVNGDPIVSCVPLVTGTDLLTGLEYLGIGGQLFVYTNRGRYPDAVPTLDNLGDNINLYFFTSSTDE